MTSFTLEQRMLDYAFIYTGDLKEQLFQLRAYHRIDKLSMKPGERLSKETADALQLAEEHIEKARKLFYVRLDATGFYEVGRVPEEVK